MGRDRQRSRIFQLLHRSAARAQAVQVFVCDQSARHCWHDHSGVWHVCAGGVAGYGFCGDLPNGDGLGESSFVADCVESGVDDVYVLDELWIGKHNLSVVLVEIMRGSMRYIIST